MTERIPLLSHDSLSEANATLYNPSNATHNSTPAPGQSNSSSASSAETDSTAKPRSRSSGPGPSSSGLRSSPSPSSSAPSPLSASLSSSSPLSTVAFTVTPSYVRDYTASPEPSIVFHTPAPSSSAAKAKRSGKGHAKRSVTGRSDPDGNDNDDDSPNDSGNEEDDEYYNLISSRGKSKTLPFPPTSSSPYPYSAKDKASSFSISSSYTGTHISMIDDASRPSSPPIDDPSITSNPNVISFSLKPTFAQVTEIDSGASKSLWEAKGFAPLIRSNWETVKARAPYYIPSIRWIPRYTWAQFRSDLIAGITIAVMIVPQGLSYSQLANLPAVFGLYAAFVPLIVYTLLGTSKQMSVGPEAVVAILTGAALSGYENMDDRILNAGVLCLLVGLLTFAFGLFRLGFLDSVLSRALVEGFVLATAVVIMVEQLHTLLGLQTHVDQSLSTIDKLKIIFSHMDETEANTCAFGFTSLAFLLAVQFAKKAYPNNTFLRFFPAILVVVIFGTIISWQVNPSNVEILGEAEGGFFSPKAPELTVDRLTSLIGPAAIITVVGFVEASAISKTYSAKYSYQVSPNRELVALGAANILGSFFGAYPTFASLPRSAINDMAGAKTQMTGLVVASIITVTIGTLLSLFHHLPKAVMAAIVFNAAIALLHFEQVKHIVKLRAYRDGLLLLLTFIVTLAIGVEIGIVLGIAISILLIIQHTTLPRMTILGGISGTDKFKSVDEFPQAQRIEGLLVIKIEEALYFANTGQLKDLLRRIELLGHMHAHPSQEPSLPPIRSVIFDIKDMPKLDASAVQILMEIVHEYHSRNIDVCFVKLRDSNKELFLRSGLVELVGPDHIFNKIKDAKHFLEGSKTSFSSYQNQY